MSFQHDAFQHDAFQTFVEGEASVAGNPPFRRPWLATALAAWSVAPILVFGPGIGTPTSVAADQVPINRAHVQVARAQWEVADTVVPRRQYAPQGTVAPASQPFVRRSVQWEEVTWEPTKRRYAPQAAVVEQQPFARPWLNVAQAAWDQPGILIHVAGGAGQEGTPQVVVSQPFTRPWLTNALAAWEPVPQDTQKQRFAPTAPAVVVDQPFTRPWLAVALAGWDLPSVIVWQQGSVGQEGPAPEVVNPPPNRKWLKTAVSAWDAPALIPLWGSVAIPEGSPPVSHGDRKWLSTAIASWEPEFLRPPKQKKYPQAAVGPADPPVGGTRPWLKVALQAWEPPEPEARQQPKRQVIDGPAPVPGPTVDYQGDGKKHKRKNKTKKLFDDIERTLNAYFKPISVSIGTENAAIENDAQIDRHYVKLAEIAKGDNDLLKRLVKVERDLSEYRESRLRDEEDEWLMM